MGSEQQPKWWWWLVVGLLCSLAAWLLFHSVDVRAEELGDEVKLTVQVVTGPHEKDIVGRLSPETVDECIAELTRFLHRNPPENAKGLFAGCYVPAPPLTPVRDNGQWENVDPATRAWFSKLMQPDTIGGMSPGISCCGEADAYWADEVRVRDGKLYAVITDERDDGPLQRIHEDLGTEYEIPPNKIVGKEQALQGNPTGHTMIFLGTKYWNNGGQQTRPVLCFVQNGGV